MKKSKQEMTGANVLLYCRVSTDEQADGCSLDMQELYLRQYCDANEYNIIDIYKEDYSAKHYDMRRPEMSKMYNYCKKHKREVDRILFLRWDRYSRNVEFAFAYKRKFHDELGIEINAIENPIDFSATEWSTMLSIYCGVAHTEDEKISKRTKDGIHGTLLKGKCANKAPRGYKNHRVSKHETYVEVDANFAPIITKVFDEVAKGVEAPCRIRRRLCPKISESSFLEMLRNPFYIGKIRVPAYRDDPEQIVDGVHEAIINEDVFYRVQDILDGKRKNTPKLTGTKRIHPDLFLRKFLVCPKCGHALTGAGSKGNGGRYYYYFCCHDHKHLNMRAEEMNDKFVKYVGTLKPNETVLQLYEQILAEIRDEGNRDKKAEIARLKKELAEQEKLVESVEDKYFSNEIDSNTYQKMLKRYNGVIENVKSKIEMLTGTIKTNIEPKLKYSISLINNIDKFIADAPVEVKIKLISSMFPEKIEFDGIRYRTKSYNKVLDLIYQETKELRTGRIESGASFDTHPATVPRAGLKYQYSILLY